MTNQQPQLTQPQPPTSRPDEVVLNERRAWGIDLSVEPIQTIINMWHREELTTEQTIGKILVWLFQYYTTHLKLQADVSRLKSRVAHLEAKLASAPELPHITGGN